MKKIIFITIICMLLTSFKIRKTTRPTNVNKLTLIMVNVLA
ncbi:MAG: hypothetical protein ACI9XJ_002671, partial [Marivirga sp.]